jgi:alkanesulfonate monooxygenase SsuD/methylene tetrahydromethanopterin reductase-like flavin-dependent oxidoreductase (luciferase family)
MSEAGGVDSIWQTDRIVSRQPFLESMTTMAALAGRTRRMRFGMNVVSLTFRDPVLLAKQCATIDVLSDGRLHQAWLEFPCRWRVSPLPVTAPTRTARPRP